MIKISANVINTADKHSATLTTGDNTQAIAINPKTQGRGSSANGAELLSLALATCYCNDIFREAALRNIAVSKVEVEVSGNFDGTPGSPLRTITYSAIVEADASEEDIVALMRHTDTVAEIQNTLRQGGSVTLSTVKAISHHRDQPKQKE